MQLQPFAASPGPHAGAPDPLPADQVLMHGLAKGLEGLLGAKPVPPAPKIVCDVPPTCHASVTRLPVRSARPAPRQDSSPRKGGGQVVRLPVRSRKPVFAASSVKRPTEPRLVRL